MTGTEVATTQPGNALALTGGQDYWNDKQLAALRQIGVDQASEGDLAVFMHVCQRTGLDPFARQIYMIKRDGKQVIQTGIDGMRLVARRAVDRGGESLSISAPAWCGDDGIWHDVWLEDGPPRAARVAVLRGGGSFTAVALWREYVQTKRDGGITMMWSTRGAGQLAKCAEALALRKACPQDLSGVYSEEELAAQHPDPQRASGMAQAFAEKQPPESPLLNTSSGLARRMFQLLSAIGKDDKPDRLAYCSQVVGRDLTTSTEMTDADAEQVIAAIEATLAEPFPPTTTTPHGADA